MTYKSEQVLQADAIWAVFYEGAPFTSDDIGDYYGFVYRITNTTNHNESTTKLALI